MKRCILLAMILSSITGFTQEQWANFAKYEKANKEAGSPTAVFMGNSITEGWRAERPEFFTDNNYAGRGISGQVTAQMLVRFRADVLDMKPKAVVILGGTNDIAENQGYISLEHTFDNIISMAELAEANDLKVFICSILPVYDYPWKPGLQPAEKIKKLNSMLRSYVQQKKSKKITYIDFYSPMVDQRGGLPDKYSTDGVHVNSDGYAVMESVLMPELKKL